MPENCDLTIRHGDLNIKNEPSKIVTLLGRNEDFDLGPRFDAGKIIPIRTRKERGVEPSNRGGVTTRMRGSSK